MSLAEYPEETNHGFERTEPTRFLKAAGLGKTAERHVTGFIVAFVMHLGRMSAAAASSNAHEITSAFAVSPLTPTLSPGYRGEGVIS